MAEGIFLVYLIVLNALGFILMGVDKKRAINKQWRIKEITFFTIAILGGGVFTYIGMKNYRHKTKHKSFTIGIPVLTILSIGVLYFIYTALGTIL